VHDPGTRVPALNVYADEEEQRDSDPSPMSDGSWMYGTRRAANVGDSRLTPKPVMVTVASTVRCPRDHAARAGLVGRSRRVSNDAMCSFVQCAASSGNMCPIPAAIWTSASGLTTRK